MTRAASLGAFLEDARRRVDEALDRYLPSPPDCPPLIAEAMRYSLRAGGKRLRPVLVLAAAEAIARIAGSGAADVGASHAAPGTPHAAPGTPHAAPGTPPAAPGTPHAAPGTPHAAPRTSHLALDLALPAACAVEFIHTYSLIHDDLPAMDNDTLRRGRPTLHVVYGDAVAILAGDALQAEAFALLAREPQTADPDVIGRKVDAIRVIASAAGACGMVGGQVIDVQGAGQAPGHETTLDAEGLRAMHLRKTGALIRASAAAGAIMAGGAPHAVAAVDRWGAQVGLAFQIVDDVLDVEGSASELGKTAGKDAAGGKPTYPALFGLERSKAMAAECGDRARAVLEDAGLADSWLPAIADWVITRRS